MAANTQPIWLGSSTRHEVVQVMPIRQVVPPDMHNDDFVLTIERMEDLASQYELQGTKKYVQAAECLEQAINRRLGLLGERHPELLLAIERHVCNCNYWGIQCLQTRQHSASLELLKKAQAMTEAELVPNFKRRVHLRSQTFNNLCCYFHARGKLNAAIQCVDRALKIEQRYKDHRNTARTHLNYGVLLSLMARHSEAMEHSECAIALMQDQEHTILRQYGMEGVFGEGADPVLRAKYEETVSSLVVAYHNTGVELTKAASHDQALDFLNHAAQIAEQKLGLQSPFTVAVQGTLAATAKLHPPSPIKFQRSTLLATDRTELLNSSSKSGKDATAITAPVQQPASQEAVDMLPAIGTPNTPRKPKSAHAPRQKKSLREMRVMEQIRSGVSLLGPPGQLSVRPRLGDSKTLSAHVGSPIIQQTVHGIAPMCTLRLPQQHAEEDKDPSNSSRSSIKLHKSKPRAPGQGEIPETTIGVEVPDGFSLPQIIANYQNERAQEGSDSVVVKPCDQRVQAIAAMKKQMMQTQAQDPSMTLTAQREELGSAEKCAVRRDSTRGLAVQYVSAARPAIVEYEAAVFIQKVVRGWVARRRILKEVERVAHRAATRLQRLWRSVKSRRAAAAASNPVSY